MKFPKKRDFQILFRDSSEEFLIFNARLFCEAGLVRFMVFDNEDKFIECVYYPLINIFRIKVSGDVKK